LFSGQCVNIQDAGQAHLSVAGGWIIDRQKGDGGHAGISEIRVSDNQQSIKTLRGYNYQPTSDTVAQVSGQVCGSGGEGAGAIFDRVYRVFLVRP
jgi:hypothetical protein